MFVRRRNSFYYSVFFCFKGFVNYENYSENISSRVYQIQCFLKVQTIRGLLVIKYRVTPLYKHKFENEKYCSHGFVFYRCCCVHNIRDSRGERILVFELLVSKKRSEKKNII